MMMRKRLIGQVKISLTTKDRIFNRGSQQASVAGNGSVESDKGHTLDKEVDESMGNTDTTLWNSIKGKLGFLIWTGGQQVANVNDQKAENSPMIIKLKKLPEIGNSMVCKLTMAQCKQDQGQAEVADG